MTQINVGTPEVKKLAESEGVTPKLITPRESTRIPKFSKSCSLAPKKSAKGE
jgi:hypothetical protein